MADTMTRLKRSNTSNYTRRLWALSVVGHFIYLHILCSWEWAWTWYVHGLVMFYVYHHTSLSIITIWKCLQLCYVSGHVMPLDISCVYLDMLCILMCAILILHSGIIKCIPSSFENRVLMFKQCISLSLGTEQ